MYPLEGSFALDASAYVEARYRTTGATTTAPNGRGEVDITPDSQLTCEIGVSLTPRVSVGVWVVDLEFDTPIDFPAQTVGGPARFEPQHVLLASPDISVNPNRVQLYDGRGTFSIVNRGSGSLNATIVPSAGLYTTPPMLVIEAGQQRQVEVMGSAAGSLTVQSNDPDQPELRMTVDVGAGPRPDGPTDRDPYAPGAPTAGATTAGGCSVAPTQFGLAWPAGSALALALALAARRRGHGR
jgi:hypothetical protein